MAGFYRLVEVDGKGLPNVIEVNTETIAVISGWFELREDGTCETGIVIGIDAVLQRVECVYVLDGQGITVTNDVGIALGGLVDGVSLLLTDENGLEWRFTI